MLRARRSGMAGRRRPAVGFTLVEMMVTIVLMSILMALAAPSMMSWVRNGKVRTTADSLQNGLRQAQTESLRRSRQVSFSLTDSKPTSADASIKAKVDGLNWAVHVLPSMAAGEAATLVDAGVLTDVASGVTTQGPAAICFNSVGRLVANSGAGVKTATDGATCTIDTDPTKPVSYVVAMAGSDRPLHVVVTLGGQVRMCDPNKSLSSTHPDGCAP